MQLLGELVKATNKYLLKTKEPKVLLLRNVGKYVHKILAVLGVIEDNSSFGFSAGESSQTEDSSRLNGIVDALSTLRSEVRNLTQSTLKDVNGGDLTADAIKKALKALLKETDKVRDEVLPNFGIRLEDKPDGSAVWKDVGVEEMQKSLAEKEKVEKENLHKKLSNKVSNLGPRITKAEDASRPPADLFQTSEFSKWDEEGLPTHDSEGKELTAKRAKKLKGIFSKAQKNYTKHLEKVEKEGDYIEGMRKELAEMEAKVAELEKFLHNF